jgi:hypothetical protein
MRTQIETSTQPIYDFPVRMENVYTYDQEQIKGSRVVRRVDTGRPLAIVSERYRLIPHKELVDASEPFIQKLGKAEKKFTLEKDGARRITEYTFRDNVISLPGHKMPGQSKAVGDTVALRLYGINSYNTSTPFEMRLAAMVLRCLNGMTVGQDIFGVKFRHIGEEQDISFPSPDTVFSTFERAGETWRKLANTGINDKQTKELVQLGKDNLLLTDRTYKENEDRFRYAETAWDLYNSMTYVITNHRVGKIQESTRIGRFDRLNEVFNNYFNPPQAAA